MYILFKHTWNILQIDHMLSYKTSSSKFKKFEIISNLFSNENSMSLVIHWQAKISK